MPPQRSRTQATNPNPKRKAGVTSGAGFSPSSTPVDVDLPQSMPHGSKYQFKGPIDSYALTPLETHPRRSTPEPNRKTNRKDSSSTATSSSIREIAVPCPDPVAPPATSTRSGPSDCIQGAVTTAVQPCAIVPSAVTPQVHLAQPNSAIDAPTGSRTKRAESKRTHVVRMFAADTPSITRTSPTPPPAFRPARHVTRPPPNLARPHDAVELPDRHRPRRSLGGLEARPVRRARAPRHVRDRPTDCGIESERDIGGNEEEEEEEDGDDDNDNDNDSWIPGLIAERREVSSDIAEPTGSAVVAGSLSQTEAVLELPVQGSLNRKQPYEDPPTAPPSTLRKSSHGRTIADYDRTNARIRALNAELLADPGSQPRSHRFQSQFRTPACRTLRSDSGVGVRYLNVPGAVSDALMAIHARGWRRRTSSAGTGIVDISDSESSQFESDEEAESGRTPGGTESEAETRSDPPVYGEIHRERPEQAASTATTPAEPEDRVSAGGPCSSIIDPAPPTDAHGPQRQRCHTVLFVHDRAADDDRLQPVLLQNGTPASSTLPPPAPQGKKRARDPKIDRGPWLDRVRVEASDGPAREGKRRKAT